ncbi:MAG TPA: hypothetical protein VF575_03010 [Candidatus Saccharimonadales bacterium]|jgi:hypothetical protein
MIRARSTVAIAATLCALIVGVIWTAADSSASAQAPAAGAPIGTGNGLKIAPVRTDLTIDKGTSRTVSLFVENVTASPVTVRGVTNDFIPSDDESGEPRIILDESQRAPGNSFKSLLSDLPTVTLQPGERREVKVTLSVPAKAASGGYYGAVRFSPGNGENDKNVALSASVGSIFLVRVPGNITEKISIESFGVAHNNELGSLFSSGPISVETRFRNFGNIHVQPFGKIYIKNFSGKIIETIEINNAQPRGSILPASIRKFSNPVSNKKFFGKYTAEASFGYGSNGELLLAKKTFYVIPYKLIGGVIALLVFVVFILPRLIRAYNESIIRKAKQNRRR